MKNIYKSIILLVFMTISIGLNAQSIGNTLDEGKSRFGVSLGAGVNSLNNAGLYSENKLHLQGSLEYYISRTFKTRARLNTGTLENDDIDCGYSFRYYSGIVDFMANAPEIMGFGSNGLLVYPFVGAGYANYDDQNLFIASTGFEILYPIRAISDNFRVGLEAGRMGYYGQKHTFDGHYSTTDAGFRGWNDYVVAKVSYAFGDLPASKKKVKALEEDDKKSCCEDFKFPEPSNTIVNVPQVPNRYVTFDEGGYCLGEEDLEAIIVNVEYAKAHPEERIIIVAAACTGQGSIIRNQYLSDLRAWTIAEKMIAMGVPREQIVGSYGLGKDVVYDHTVGKIINSDVQKWGHIIFASNPEFAKYDHKIFTPDEEVPVCNLK